MFSLLVLHGSSRDETDLEEYADRVTPHRRPIAPRGTFAEGHGFTFFKRRADFSIDSAEVTALAERWLRNDATHLFRTAERIIVAGYSSGAIFAEALLSVMPDRFAGAILMRPEPLSADFSFPKMPGKPILILAGRHDERRRPEDASRLAEQLEAAGANVILHILNAGHGWAPDDRDVALSHAWLNYVQPGSAFPPSRIPDVAFALRNPVSCNPVSRSSEGLPAAPPPAAAAGGGSKADAALVTRAGSSGRVRRA